jgi:uncharacterized RDD family membrane protein YckC
VKCPKCSYLGFETGDRCRNCGYDFSLIAHHDTRPVEPDLELRSASGDVSDVSDWLIRFEETQSDSSPSESFSRTSPELPTKPPPAVPSSRNERESRPSRDSKLPLFKPSSRQKGDEPLIKLPVTPRPPLAVRRTPDHPRLRAVPNAVRPVERVPALEFGETAGGVRPRDDRSPVPPRTVSRVSIPEENEENIGSFDASGPFIRVIAAVIDHVLLGAIDLAVIYFTLRIAGLPMNEWAVLPAVPLVLFLLVLKMAYFYAFTTVGGQTIGKMAMRIRVVTEENASIDANLALQRTLLGAASTAVLGLGLLPAFFDPERRAFHDRVVHTRVIALRTA